MKTRARNEFKTWQPLPEVAATRSTTPAAAPTGLPAKPAGTTAHGPAFQKNASASEKQKLIFTTHD
jgi:hypothetical protein